MSKNSNAILETQKKAIYNGLLTILSDAEANSVLDDWSKYFNETDSVFNGLNNFARDVCKTYQKDDQQRDLVRALNRALLFKDQGVSTPVASAKAITPKESAPKEPAVDKKLATGFFDVGALAPVNNDNSLDEKSLYADQIISTPDFITFQHLLLKLINLVNEYSDNIGEEMHLFLNELIQSMPWSETQQQQLTILLATGSTNQVRTYKPDQLKSFFKHWRTWLTDEMGEKDADKLINQAVNETEMLGSSAQYSARKFI